MNPNKYSILGTATMNEKGQIIIPSEARNKLGFENGDRFMIVDPKQNGTVIVIKAEIVEEHMKNWMDAINQSKREET